MKLEAKSTRFIFLVGFLSYNTRFDADSPDVASLPEFLKQNRWYTLANGEVFDVTSDSAQSWSEPVWNPDRQWHSNQEVDERGEHLQKGYLQPLKSGRPSTAERMDAEDDAYPNELENITDELTVIGALFSWPVWFTRFKP